MSRDLISAVARRTALLHALTAAAFGVLVGALLLAMLALAGATPGARATAAILAGMLAAFGIWRRTARSRGTRAAAVAIERTRPSANVMITAEELRREPSRASDWIRSRIEADASRTVDGLPVARVVSSRAPLALAAVATLAAALALAVGLHEERVRDIVRRTTEPPRGTPATGTDALRIRVVVRPPAYTGRAEATLTDPERIEALEGSGIRFDLPDGSPWRIRFGTAEQGPAFVAREDGYFVVETQAGGAPARLIPLTVMRDRAPVVRIDAPARDLLLPDGGRRIAVSVHASDDLALDALELRYTKVSGAGEQFEFEEGSVPIAAKRESGREWRGDAQLPLDVLRLRPGDSLVYRAVARDRRPGEAGLGSSDTFFVEIAGPGQVPLEGVEMPPEMARYAMSQQMIVLKIERLRAREASLPRAALLDEAASLAAEQRTVRASFVFLLGGHVEDEEEEAEQSHEIQEGRLENTARRDIDTALSHMTRAEQGLIAVDTAAALPPARLAVDALQRAFGRSRYLLRSLASRSRLDPSRRLRGDLRDAGDWRRAPGAAEPSPGDAARRVLARLLEVAATQHSDDPAGDLDGLAESALAIDPASSAWQEVSSHLLATRHAPTEARTRALREAIAIASREARAGSVPRTPLSEAPSAVRRAWQAEQRR